MTRGLSFYLAVIGGEIDRKLRLTQRDLTLAFRSGSLAPYIKRDDLLKIYYVDLDNVSITQISLDDIRNRLSENDNARIARNEAERRREIQKQIEQLKKQL